MAGCREGSESFLYNELLLFFEFYSQLLAFSDVLTYLSIILSAMLHAFRVYIPGVSSVCHETGTRHLTCLRMVRRFKSCWKALEGITRSLLDIYRVIATSYH